ncbi:MAG: MFS transporter [Candidatus Bathyarchaeia archaeon]
MPEKIENDEGTLKDSHKNAYLAILLLGIVSLMGDIVYEGSRGIIPSYLELLGATAFTISFVGGLGDFLGYVFRFVSGFIADTKRMYWPFVFLGYGLIAAIPLLGLPLGLEIAILLVLLERLGKALRSPSRDTILSVISKGVGAGKAFGIHELLDQVGAILGPFVVAFLMLSTGNYNLAFSFLSIPFLMLLAVLTYTYKKIGAQTLSIEPKKSDAQKRFLPKAFYFYTFAVLLNTVGLVPYTIILIKASEILKPVGGEWLVPVIYLLIQGVDAPTALAAGFAYDKFGIKVLVAPFLLSLIPSLIVMGYGVELQTIVFAAAIFGLVLGMHESIYRAAVSRFAPDFMRGTAYGIFNIAYGVGLLVGGAVYGVMADYKLPFPIIAFYAFLTQIIALLLLNISSKMRI